MSSSQWDVTHEYIPTEAHSAISCIPLTPRWLIRCSLRICIIFHCTVGPFPMKFESKIPLCSYNTVPKFYWVKKEKFMTVFSWVNVCVSCTWVMNSAQAKGEQEETLRNISDLYTLEINNNILDHNKC